jgi:hypothetical protein
MGHSEIVDLLLSRGASLEAKALDGRTALMYAVANNHEDVVMLLIRKGADVNAKSSDNGGTALMAAAWNGHAAITGHLLNAGASYTARRSDGATAMDIAQARGHISVLNLIKYSIPDHVSEIRSGDLDGYRTVVHRRDFGVSNPCQYLEFADAAPVGIAALNHFRETIGEIVRKWCASEENTSKLPEEQALQDFLRLPQSIGGREMFANGLTPKNLITKAMLIHHVSGRTKLEDLPSNAYYRQRAAHAALLMYEALKSEMDAAAVKARNNELFESFPKNQEFLSFYSSAFDSLIKRKIHEMNELAFSD